MVVFTGMVKTRKGENKQLLDVEKNDLLTFKRLKDAKKYISDNNYHALIAAKVVQSDNVWYSTDVYYQFI